MDLIQTIENLMNPDNKIRGEAEILISKYLEENFSDYLEKLCKILSEESYSLRARQMASTLVKNPIRYMNIYKEKWIGLPNEKKQSVKSMILATLGSKEILVRQSAASCISSLAKVETPISKNFPDLLPVLCQEKFENMTFHLAAIETLGYICEEFTKSEILPNEVDQILSAIVLAMKNHPNELEMINLALSGLIKIFPLIGSHKMMIKEYSGLIMNEIFNIGNNYQNNNKILVLICRIFIELAENYYDAIGDYLDKISSFTFSLISCNNEKLVILCFEFWCKLGGEEVSKQKQEKEKKVSLCKYYLKQAAPQIKEIIDKNIVLPQGKEDLEDDWNTSKASCYLLVLLVQVCDIVIVETLIGEVKESIQSDNLYEKKKALLKLTCCLETSHQNLAFQLSVNYMKRLFNFARNDNSYEIKLVACKALSKLTKIVSPYFEANHLKDVIPALKDFLYVDNKIGISISICLNNIIKNVGDLKTSKSKNLISPYFNELMETLIRCDEKLEFFERDNNFSVYAFLTIENLIDYSSHDKQNKLMEYLVYFVLKLKNLPQRLDLTSNIIDDLESHYCVIIRKIIRKLVSKLQIDDCKNIYEVVVGTFIKRNGVYDEGILAISSLAISKFE